MKVALIFGEKSEVVKKKLQSQKDNLYIDCYPAVPQMMNVSMQRGLIYDRILMLSDLVNPDILRDLKQYWSISSKNTSVVLLCRKGMDEPVAKMFSDIFQTTVACPMLVESTTVNLVLSAVIEPVSALSQRYGLGNGVQTEEDNGVELNIPQQTQQPVSQPVQQPVQAPIQQQPVQENVKEKPKKDKKSGGLFGRKKKDKESVQQAPMQNQAPQQQMPANQAQMSQNQMQMQMNQAQMPQNQQIQNRAPQQMQNIGTQYNYLSERADLNFGRPMQQPMQTQQQVQPNQQTQQTSVQGYPNQQFQSANNGFNNAPQNFTQQQPMKATAPISQVPKQEVQQDIWSQSVDSMQACDQNTGRFEESNQTSNIDDFENFEVNEQTPVSHEAQSSSDDFEAHNSQNSIMDESVGNEFTPDVESQPSRYSMKGYTQAVASRAETEDVDEDLGDLGVASIEASYRQENEAPKVIYKEVQKEVIVSSARTIDSILKGNNHIIYLVTGDRGSLITTVSMKIAELVSKTSHVLYVDCDTERHGVLSHIEYDEFCKFEPTKMSGIKHCNSPRLLKSCVCNFASNFDLLTSDYSCDTSEAELKSTLETVAGVFTEYGVTVIDCPIDKLHLMSMNILLLCKTVVCVEASRRGYMNTLCELESLNLDMSYKRTFASTGTLLHTKVAPKLDINKLRKYIGSIYEADEVDWMSMRTAIFTGEMDKKLLGILTNM